MEILLTVVVGTLCIVCFFLGAKLGQTVTRGEKIETPREAVINAVRERKSKKEAEYKQERLDTIMRNIESYDGTANGQEDVPRG
jgi:hypothetical protein